MNSIWNEEPSSVDELDYIKVNNLLIKRCDRYNRKDIQNNTRKQCSESNFHYYQS